MVLVCFATATRTYHSSCLAGAAALNNKPLSRIEVHGKNLFYFFGNAANPEVLHFHFGMSGAFRVMSLPGTFWSTKFPNRNATAFVLRAPHKTCPVCFL